MKISSVRPSPALVVAVVALVVALGGSAYAAATINGKNIKKHSISGNRLKNNTVTGSQVKESTLGTVPAAKTAQTATHATSATSATKATSATTANRANVVDGNEVASFNFTVASGAASQTDSLPGVTLSANCPGGAVNLDAVGTVASGGGESISVQGYDEVDHAFGTNDSNLNTGSNDSLSPESGTTGNGTAVITRPSSGVTTIDFAYATTDTGCTYSGTAVGTP